MKKLHLYVNTLFVFFIFLFYVLQSKGVNTILNRPVWHNPPKVWSNYIEKEGVDSSQQILDVYSLTHISHGVLFYHIIKWITGVNNPLRLAVYTLLVEMIWEMVENTQYIIDKYRETDASRNYKGDSWINSFGDLWMAYIGILIAQNLSPELQASIVIGSELWLYAVRGDNLLTNIINIFT